MNCKSCGYGNSRVVETTQNERTNHVMRRRECIKCGMRYTTQEHIHDRPNFKTPPPKSVLEK